MAAVTSCTYAVPRGVRLSSMLLAILWRSLRGDTLLDPRPRGNEKLKEAEAGRDCSSTPLEGAKEGDPWEGAASPQEP